MGKTDESQDSEEFKGESNEEYTKCQDTYMHTKCQGALLMRLNSPQETGDHTAEVGCPVLEEKVYYT